MNWMQVEAYLRHDDRAVLPIGQAVFFVGSGRWVAVVTGNRSRPIASIDAMGERGTTATARSDSRHSIGSGMCSPSPLAGLPARRSHGSTGRRSSRRAAQGRSTGTGVGYP